MVLEIRGWNWVSPELRRIIIAELGIYDPGETNWFEYRDKFESLRNFYWYTNHDGKELFLEAVGPIALKALRRILHPDTIEETDLKTILDQIEAHYFPSPNQEYYIAKLRARKQHLSEPFFTYVSSIRVLVGLCQFGKRDHVHFRNQLMSGCTAALRERFVKTRCQTLTDVFEEGLRYDMDIFIKRRRYPKTKKAQKLYKADLCLRCNESIKLRHGDEKCPFDWAICSYCNMKGHLGVACKYKDITCHNCYTMGHVAKICKRKKVNPMYLVLRAENKIK